MYPFGLTHKGYNDEVRNRPHNYGYNGKEEQNELRLAWLDLGARMYDPSLARFITIDPMADFIHFQSSYVMANNNSVSNVDYYGLGILNGIGNIFKRIKAGIGNLFNCNCPLSKNRVSESFGDSLRRPDFNKKRRSNKRKKTNTKQNNNHINRELLSPITLDTQEITKSDIKFDTPGFPPFIQITNPEIPIFRKRKINSVISFEDVVRFRGNSNKFTSSPLNNKTLNDLIKTLKEYPQLTLLIRGNTSSEVGLEPKKLNDPTKINGRSGFTIKDLQLARARAIEKFLIGQGINWRRLKVGNGETRAQGAKGRTTTFTLKNK